MRNAENKKSRRNRRLHIIFFIDSQQTKSVSLSLANFWFAIAAFFVFTGLGALSIYQSVELRRSIAAQENLILDLKSTIFAEGVVTHNALSPEFANTSSEQHKMLAEVLLTASELRGQSHFAAPSKSKDPVVSANTEVTAIPTVSMVVQTTTKRSEPETEARDSAQKVQLQALAPTPAIPAEEKVPASPIAFEDFAIAEEEPGTTAIQFNLQNSHKARKGPIAGWVCAAVEIQSDDGVVLRPAPPSVTLPASLNGAVKSCRGGEFVKFARLRPTELTVAATQKNIRKVVLYFSENATGKVYSQAFPVESIAE